MFGNVVGRRAYFPVEGSRHYANLYVAQVGRSSKGRKGVSTSRAKQALRGLDEWWENRRIRTGLSSGEGLVEAVRDAQEGPSSPAAEDKRLLVIEPEFAQALAVMARPGNTLSAVVRNAWDGVPLDFLTRSNSARASESHISIVGSITLDELLSRLDQTDVLNGFANRFLWLYVANSKRLANGGAGLDLTDLHERLSLVLRDVNALSADPAWADGMRRDPEAAELWEQAYNGELAREYAGALDHVLSRSEAQALRLSMVYALLDGSFLVRRTHVESALELWRYCERSACRIFGGSTGDPAADRILSALRSAGPKGLARTEITRSVFRNNIRATELDRAFDLLRRAGQARETTRRNEGAKRPVEVWVAAEFYRQAAA
jgi:hypothetical protein